MSFNQESEEAPTPAAAPVATAAAAAAAPLSVAPAIPDIESIKSTPFNAEDYSTLCLRYLSPRIRENEPLPGGTVLRRRVGQRIIDQAPYAKLKQRITDLKRRGNDGEIYRLLCELRHWEIHGGRVPDSMDQIVGASEVVELVDIVATENIAAIDVEAFVENLLAGEGESTTLITNTSAPSIVPNHLQPLPDQVPSVTSVVRMAIEPQQAVPVAGGDFETEATEGKEHEVVDLLCSSDEDNDGNITTKNKYWTKEDDDTLCNAVIALIEDSGGDKNIDWPSVSRQIRSVRSALQCWERYNKLRKNTYKTRARKCRVLMSLPDLPTPVPFLSSDTTDDFISVVGTPNSPADSSISAGSNTYMSSEEKIKTNVESGLGDDDQASLKRAWNRQSKLRTKGKWKPSGGWKAPAWASQNSAINVDMKGGLDAAADALTKTKNNKSKPKRRKISTHASCSKQVLARSLSLLAESIPEDMAVPSEVASLSELKCIGYAKKITEDLLSRAHRAQQGLLPATDCDEWEVVKMARSYYDYWRPAKGNVKAILLAESHSKTERDQMMSTRLDPSLCPQYHGPRNYIKLVHCLAYGELKCIASQEGKSTKKRATSSSSSIAQQNDSGTSQFWTLLAAASRGTGHVPSNVRGGHRNRGKHGFANDVLKLGNLSVEDRLDAKLSILQKLKDRGIWLIDVSVIGWYVSQPQKYRRSTATNEIHRCRKERPPKELKPASMVLSWELLTKHIIRQAAEEGNLNLLVLIGKELENILSMERITEAVNFGSIAAGSSSAHRCNIESIPAPNAWIPGGYRPWYENVASLMDEYAPDSSSI